VPGYQGKVAVVTGGASGIGYAIAARARAGDIVAGRNPGNEPVDPDFRRSTGRPRPERQPSRMTADRPRTRSRAACC
jgi:NAD(P)-dependent dehydrogenase (short-subunit alcohol dehydrogenase family)